jgi:hypothetical protein
MNNEFDGPSGSRKNRIRAVMPAATAWEQRRQECQALAIAREDDGAIVRTRRGEDGLLASIVWRSTFSTAQRSAASATPSWVLVQAGSPAATPEDQGRQEGDEHQGDEELDQREAGLAGARGAGHEPDP